MGHQERKITIGRDPACDVALADATVSSRHAELSFLPGDKLLLTDCKSRNGTYLQSPGGHERRVHQELVSPQDRLRFGDVRLTLGDILEAVRRDESVAEPTPRIAANPPLAQGRRLERCDCGSVKVSGAPCPGCGR